MNMNMTRTEMPGEEAEIAKAYLQEVLVDLIDLTLQAKQAHWNVVGPRFRSVHLELDDLVEITRRFGDTVAERIVTLGDPAVGSPSEVGHQTKLDPLPSGFLKDADVVKEFVERLSEICARMRRNLGALSERDPVSHDLLVQILGRLEEKMWMFHAQTH